MQSTDYSLSDGVTLSSLIDTEQGYISRRIFSDADIYELEMERIFRRTWLFLGHESEIPNPGDNVTRSMAGEPVILVRDGDGVVRAFSTLVAIAECVYVGQISITPRIFGVRITAGHTKTPAS